MYVTLWLIDIIARISRKYFFLFSGPPGTVYSIDNCEAICGIVPSREMNRTSSILLELPSVVVFSKRRQPLAQAASSVSFQIRKNGYRSAQTTSLVLHGSQLYRFHFYFRDIFSYLPSIVFLAVFDRCGIFQHYKDATKILESLLFGA